MDANKAIEILTDAVNVGSWHVTADTLPEIGWLIEHGYLMAIDDPEGPRLFPSDKGRQYAGASPVSLLPHGIPLTDVYPDGVLLSGGGHILKVGDAAFPGQVDIYPSIPGGPEPIPGTAVRVRSTDRNMTKARKGAGKRK